MDYFHDYSFYHKLKMVFPYINILFYIFLLLIFFLSLVSKAMLPTTLTQSKPTWVEVKASNATHQCLTTVWWNAFDKHCYNNQLHDPTLTLTLKNRVDRLNKAILFSMLNDEYTIQVKHWRRRRRRRRQGGDWEKTFHFLLGENIYIYS